jgi:hypothetical protein
MVCVCFCVCGETTKYKVLSLKNVNAPWSIARLGLAIGIPLARRARSDTLLVWPSDVFLPPALRLRYHII